MYSDVSQDGKRRYKEAIARKKIRLDRFVSPGSFPGFIICRLNVG